MNCCEFFTIAAIAVALAMDAFAVSIVSGSVFRHLHIRHGIRMAVFFGAFQSLMPLLGWAAGKGLQTHIQPFDHWLAFGLLTFIGGKMAIESLKIEKAERTPSDPSNLIVLLALSVATSIDALAVGLTLSLVTEHIFSAVLLIGLITFVISLLGWEIGKRIGRFFETQIELAGGLILIGIGLKILFEHLLSS
ncbi:MAG: manganese efflux pump MntP family protein [Anaerohalosphaeraceae bacterium]